MKIAEESVSERAPDGVSEHEMTGAWRVIIARRGESARTWYYNANDHPRFIDALRKNAKDWLDAQN